MNRHIYTFTIALLAIISCHAQTTKRGGGGTDTRVTTKGDKRALIIGISDYEHDTLDLNYADDDAELFRDYLLNIEKVTPDNIIYLVNNNATAQAIYQGIDQMVKLAQKDDEIYIYFAGHGDVVNRENEKVGFLLAHDVNEGRNYRGTDGVVALASLNDFVNDLTTTGAKVIMALDACHSGFIYEEGAKKNMNTLSDGNNFVRTTKFLSCAPSQVSKEDASIGHGYFTFYLVLGMMGAADQGVQDNQLKFGELDDFIYEEVAAKTNEQQTPLLEASNRRLTFKKVIPRFKELAMYSQEQNLALKDTLRLARSQFNLSQKSFTGIEKQFFKAIERGNLDSGEQNAMQLYLDATKNSNLSGAQLSRMQFTLSRKLTSNANRLINTYISGPKDLPPGREFLQESKQVRKAMSIMDKDHPTYKVLEVSALFLEAYSYIRNNDYQNYTKAEKLLKRALEIEDRAAYVWNALGILANENQQFDDALKYYRKATNLIPDWFYPTNNKGTNLFDQYKYAEANSIFKSILNTRDDQTTSLINLAAGYSELGYYSRRDSIYSVLLANQISEPTLLTNLANSYSEKGNTRRALSYYHNALETFPENVSVYLSFANFLIDNKMNDVDASSLVNRALELQPSYARALASYGDYLRMQVYTQASIEESIAFYDKAIQKNPFYDWSYAGKGYALYKLGKVDLAIQSFEESVANGNRVEALYNYARFSHYTDKNYARADSLYQVALNINPVHKHSIDNYATLLERENKFEQAEKLLRNYAINTGSNPASQYLLGNLAYSRKTFPEAITYYKKAIDLDRGYTDAVASLALTMIESEKIEEALPFILQVTQENALKYKKKQFAFSINRVARKIKRENPTQKLSAIYKIVHDLSPSPKTLHRWINTLYLEGEANLAVNQLPEIHKVSKTWQSKFLLLQAKIEFDLNNIQNASKTYESYIKREASPDDLLGLLIESRNHDLTTVKEKIKSLSEQKFTDRYLKARYSTFTTNKIKKLRL